MNRIASLLLLLLLGCTEVFAQEPAGSLSITGPTDRPMINISNTHSLQVEAFLVTVDVARAEKRLTRIYFDAHSYYRHDRPILPGDSRQLPLPHIVGQELPVPVLRAVVLSDGTTFGDQSWVRELLQRRNIVSDRLQEVIALLKNASTQTLTRDQTIGILQEAFEARKKASVGGTPEEQVLQQMIFRAAIKELQAVSQSNAVTPELVTKVQHLNSILSAWLADIQAAKPSSAITPALPQTPTPTDGHR